MKDRGYEISGEELQIINPEYTTIDFVKYFKNKVLESESKGGKITFKRALDRTYIKQGKIKPLHIVFAETLLNEKGTKKKISTAYFEILRNEQNESDDFIIIGELGLDEGTSKKFKEMNIEYFQYDILMNNPLDSILSPTYIIMTSQEIQELLDSPDNNITDLNQLQYISYEDPIVKYFGLTIGNVLKIIRTIYQIETLVRTTIAYRLVYPITLSESDKKVKPVKAGKISKDQEDEYGGLDADIVNSEV
jgi:DNA-directed RNA polymerase subunit H (RpoH/RPB5)